YDFSAPVTADITVYAGWKMVGYEGSHGSDTAEPDEPDVDEPDVDIDDDDTPLDPTPGFTDVAEDFWGKEAIDYVVSEGLFQGTSATTFAPEMLTTRGMIMTVLARMDGVDTSASDPWYQAGMEWAVSEGVSDGTNPEAIISREQLATMLYRYFGSPEVSEETLSFSDADQVSEWASAGVRWAVSNGVISGKGNNVLDPQGSATRAEVAQMLYN
ncbi:S-layer homology domain-containing protein, partial [Pseudoflavonifractor phocaeensis]|uniref:S-layer homology domain-containing protein n=1 Tax=Pseudoflavonifractor phocaeensis TaxID=1870988 RepID=UPI001956D857